LAFIERNAIDIIRAAYFQGMVHLLHDELAPADERVSYALERARVAGIFQEILPCRIALAEIERRRDEAARAREHLEDIWEAAERGPYPIFHADGLSVLAALQHDVGHRDEAVDAATRAYRLAWCDGPPFAYHWGLEKALALLKELGAPEPACPPFDPSKHEPMPEVEIDPPDHPPESEEGYDG
jgi:hypothetical protein